MKLRVAGEKRANAVHGTSETQIRVALVGAGPGDAELLTLKAARLLAAADVVITDRLVNQDILDTHVRVGAKIIFVGKEGRTQSGSVAQKEIDQLIVKYALQGRRVVRLKGGDVAIFSNVLDELESLKEAGIAYQIVPGITAASGASAYAGIPLTARGYARGVRFQTYSERYPVTEGYWQELARTEDTLVFYMTGENWYELASRLKENGIDADKYICIIQQATTPYQQVASYQFKSLTGRPTQQSFISPSLLIIGRVPELHQQYGWCCPLPADQLESFFRPSTSRAVEVINNKKRSA
ncbi:uroporphyrinogen-III C-methyltransferase [Arachidicoccus rhizosphaerae]|jgi:uroporphyrin-III C-methyltransferase|uniref:uroporphyrinogen-III C-methyltransferase n=1 Tax=Arachidicoccus rhizosphaerae TaxID=551991 RepID=A0A1H4A6L0_9BACT|nr:uroporphyrinogen-III C-methyltransferase [Arachidicoccus rhizosphaerae]SEA31311.1 uroporphyrinogen-III C-methyltransferase [Arachidicoccus rhizosphaerae]